MIHTKLDKAFFLVEQPNLIHGSEANDRSNSFQVTQKALLPNDCRLAGKSALD